MEGRRDWSFGEESSSPFGTGGGKNVEDASNNGWVETLSVWSLMRLLSPPEALPCLASLAFFPGECWRSSYSCRFAILVAIKSCRLAASAPRLQSTISGTPDICELGNVGEREREMWAWLVLRGSLLHFT